MSQLALCVVCCAPEAQGHHSLWRRTAAAMGYPGDTVLLCFVVLTVLARPRGLWLCIDEASTWAAKSLQYTATLQREAGSGEPSVYCHTAWGMGQWVVGPLRYTAALQGAMGSGTPPVHCGTAWGCRQWGSFNTLPHRMGQWAVGSLPHTAAL